MPDLTAQKSRPQFRNIEANQFWRYKQPPPAIVSVLHRISGALLFLLGIPFVLYLFQQSLTSELSFQSFKSIVGSVPGKLVLLLLIWSYVHHTVAGIRFLLLDRHVGIEKYAASKTAVGVLVITVVVTLVLALKLFGAF